MSGILKRALRVWRSDGLRGIIERFAVRGRIMRDNLRRCREKIIWHWRRSQQTARLRDGRLLDVNPNDPGISRELVVYGTHEPDATQVISRCVKQGDTVFDLGANIGYYASLFLGLLGDAGQLICIEPAPTNAAVLRRNIARYDGTGRAIVIECAVGRESGRALLHLASESNWHSLHRRNDHTGSVQVDVWRLDDLVAHLQLRRLDLLRMDIEGQEVDVFAGMQGVLRELRPKLVMELHPQLIGSQPVRDTLALLQGSLGYRVYRLIDRELDYPWVVPARRRHPSIDEMLASDISQRCFTVFLWPKESFYPAE
jgi:FkbM family methyltransferase